MKKIITVLLLIVVIITCLCCFTACGGKKVFTANNIKGATFKFVSVTTLATVYNTTLPLNYLKGQTYNNRILQSNSLEITFDKKELKGWVGVDEAFYGSKTYNFTYTIEKDNKISAQVDGIGQVVAFFVNDIMVISTTHITGDYAVFHLEYEG